MTPGMRTSEYTLVLGNLGVAAFLLILGSWRFGRDGSLAAAVVLAASAFLFAVTVHGYARSRGNAKATGASFTLGAGPELPVGPVPNRNL